MTNGEIMASPVAPAPVARGPVAVAARRANQRYRSAIKDRLAECGFGELPQPGYWALMILASGGTDASRLIAEMGISKQAVSKLVDVLVTRDSSIGGPTMPIVAAPISCFRPKAAGPPTSSGSSTGHRRHLRA